MTVTPGTMLTCANEDCGCRLRVEVPCPHGDDYSCACGHPLTPAADEAGGGTIRPTPGA